jgi:EamA domain-containing membrane protein RarD
VKERKLKLSEIGLIAGTRGMLGAGIGLLLSSKLSAEERRAVGWTLVLVGVVTTVPLVMNLFGQKEKLPKWLPLAA